MKRNEMDITELLFKMAATKKKKKWKITPHGKEVGDRTLPMEVVDPCHHAVKFPVFPQETTRLFMCQRCGEILYLKTNGELIVLRSHKVERTTRE